MTLVHETHGQGPTLLFVHGFPLRGAAWRRQLSTLSRSYRVVVPDLPGFGAGPPPMGPTSMETYADDLAELLDTLGGEPAVLVGHSMGGYIALAFARLHPNRLRGLVLVSTKPGADSREAAAGRLTTAEKVESQGPIVVIDAMAPKMLAPGNDDRDLGDEVRELMVESTREGVVAALHAMARRSDSTPHLGEISVPTLVITGDADVIIPASESTAMAPAIPGARLEIISGAGHLVAAERPEEFNRVLGEWLGGLR